MTMTLTRRRLMTTASAVLALGVAGGVTGVPRAFAATPKDTLVEAWAFDDIITMDPGEAFEISAAEVTGNTYDTLVKLNIADTSTVAPGIAESWSASEDGLTYTFKIKSGIKFASGNPITAEDVAYSFERAVKLNKNPAFILQQFGLSGDNVAENAKAVDAATFQFKVDKPYATSFVLNCLTATVGAIVDKKLVQSHAAAVTVSKDYPYDTDFGNGWLKTNYAGSGPFKLREWRANELVVMERNDNYYGEKAKLKRVIYRFLKESSGQRLALESGDVDVARNLSPTDFTAIANAKNIKTDSAQKGTVYYLGLNQKNQYLSKPEVRQAIKYLVDYDAIGATLIKGVGTVHESFLPKGILGSINDQPYKLNVAKAKELLEKAGLKDGFKVTMDVRSIEPMTSIAQSMQQTFAQAGITLELIQGDGKQTLTKYRARNHDIYIGDWGADYWDPHSNAETFTSNPDNSDTPKSKTLAWRNAWDVPELTKETSEALLERDTPKRKAMYEDLQRKVLADGPFVIIYQKTEIAGYRANVQNYKLGPTFDSNLKNLISKD
ncbi:ABC transporter substrate-binding protein [Agrobacterium vitis]|uniref:ABC transporter substrate-binding protein n=1 Tax=Rhizobium/Agrobacterium group TaxID=227290 RepID=UPI0012E8CC3F|nr:MULTISPECIES: ABC transporter substrate-binding protein [Rhizobium/Agrobacterium group]MCF1493214.1 ABC transporter substrate-binding protein [Allorhizobium ampelinum]MVA44976.1 ABC transporter substrate-binding protein [Agrobacterium vitis]